MKKLILNSVLACLFFSCSEDADVVTNELNESAALATKSVVENTYMVIDGCLHVNSMVAYEELSNSLMGMSEKELISWSLKQGFESLLAMYKQKSLSLDTESLEIDNYKIVGAWELALHNAAGNMVVGDSIYKIVDDSMYVYKTEDVASMEDLNVNIESYAHSKYKRVEDIDPISITKGVASGDRSYVINVTSKRREYVDFSIKGVVDKNNMFIVDIKMTGKAQKKGPLGRWQLAFDDEVQWGQCFCDGIYINDKFKEGTQMASRRIVDETSVGLLIPVGFNTAALGRIVVNCRFEFCKNAIKGDEVYTHSYEVRH